MIVKIDFCTIFNWRLIFNLTSVKKITQQEWHSVKPTNLSTNQPTNLFLAAFHFFSPLFYSLFSSSSSSTSSNPFTFIFHSFFSSQARSKSLSIFLLSFIFNQWFTGTAKSTRWQILFFFLLIDTRTGLLARIGGSICISKSQKILSFSFSQTDSGLSYLPTPPLGQDMTQGQFLSEV